VPQKLALSFLVLELFDAVVTRWKPPKCWFGLPLEQPPDDACIVTAIEVTVAQQLGRFKAKLVAIASSLSVEDQLELSA